MSSARLVAAEEVRSCVKGLLAAATVEAERLLLALLKSDMLCDPSIVQEAVCCFAASAKPKPSLDEAESNLESCRGNCQLRFDAAVEAIEFWV